MWQQLSCVRVCVCIIGMKLDRMEGERSGRVGIERKIDILTTLKYVDALCQTNYPITLSWQPN